MILPFTIHESRVTNTDYGHAFYKVIGYHIDRRVSIEIKNN